MCTVTPWPVGVGELANEVGQGGVGDTAPQVCGVGSEPKWPPPTTTMATIRDRYLKCECLYDASYFRQLLLAELPSPSYGCAGLTFRHLLPSPPWWWGWSSGWLHVHVQP